MIDSRCGLHCMQCSWKESQGCAGCIESQGHPFHGSCSIAHCCQGRGQVHCGECDEIPCEKLYEYSYLDPEHGDSPPGKRVMDCRRWAAREAGRDWSHVLLTSAGFGRDDATLRRGMVDRFYQMLDKAPDTARVLFIPTAAIDGEARRMVVKCRDELIRMGIRPEHIRPHEVGEPLSIDEALAYDVIYFTGGDTGHLLRSIREADFERIIKAMVYQNRVYVGVSAGSILATPNIGRPEDIQTRGLCLVHAFLSVHCPAGTPARQDLPLSHVPLTDAQALAVSWQGYELIRE